MEALAGVLTKRCQLEALGGGPGFGLAAKDLRQQAVQFDEALTTAHQVGGRVGPAGPLAPQLVAQAKRCEGVGELSQILQDVAEVEVRLGEIVLVADGLAESRLCFLRLTLLDQGDAEVEVRLGVVVREAEGLPVGRLRLLEPALAGQGYPEGVVRLGVVVLEAEGQEYGRLRLLVPALGDQEDAEVVARPEEIMLEADGVLVGRLRLL